MVCGTTGKYFFGDNSFGCQFSTTPVPRRLTSRVIWLSYAVLKSAPHTICIAASKFGSAILKWHKEEEAGARTLICFYGSECVSVAMTEAELSLNYIALKTEQV